MPSHPSRPSPDSDSEKVNPSRLKEDTQTTQDRYLGTHDGQKTAEKNTCGVGPHPRKDEPTPVTPDRIKAAAISEYGMSGWVDPAKLSNALKLPLPQVEAWLNANYVAFERDGGTIGYRPRR